MEWSALAPRIRQTWIAANGAGRARVVYAKPEFLTLAQHKAWKAAGSPRLSSGQVEVGRHACPRVARRGRTSCCTK
jgi:hypothetical protein